MSKAARLSRDAHKTSMQQTQRSKRSDLRPLKHDYSTHVKTKRFTPKAVPLCLDAHN